MSKGNSGKKHILKELKCPFCCVKGAGPNMTRYHFDKCYLNPKNPHNAIGSNSNGKMTTGLRQEYKCPHCSKVVQNIGNFNRWHNENCKSR